MPNIWGVNNLSILIVFSVANSKQWMNSHVTPAVLDTSASIHTVPALPFEPQPSLHP